MILELMEDNTPSCVHIVYIQDTRYVILHATYHVFTLHNLFIVFFSFFV